MITESRRKGGERESSVQPGVHREAVNFYTPAAMVGYFDDVAAAVRARDVDAEALSEIARRHSMDVIGPVPEAYV